MREEEEARLAEECRRKIEEERERREEALKGTEVWWECMQEG